MREHVLTDSSTHGQVISANVEFYRQIASKYDQYESCAVDSFFQARIEDDLQVIADAFAPRRGPVRCLDCGGGTGNLTMKMLRRGWRVTVVDVSADMLAILERRVRTAGSSATFLNEPVESFFARSGESFDLISFSSVLHHLYSPVATVKNAAEHIARQGFFYSIFDPVPPSSTRAAGVFDAMDTLLAKLLYDRGDFLPGVGRRMRKLGSAKDSVHGRAVASAGDLAEYHAHRGIDDQLIVEELQRAGFVVKHQRYPVGRTRLMRWINSHLRAMLNFRMLAQRCESKSANGGNVPQ